MGYLGVFFHFCKIIVIEFDAGNVYNLPEMVLFVNNAIANFFLTGAVTTSICRYKGGDLMG